MSLVSQALRKLRALDRGERRIVAEAALLLPLVHAAQQVLPFRRWRALLTRVHIGRSPLRPPPSAEAIARAVERAQRGLPGVYKCLPAAYTAHLLLHRHGYPSIVQVGVARDARGKVEAHAWVECDGRILVGGLADLQRFVPLPPLSL